MGRGGRPQGFWVTSRAVALALLLSIGPFAALVAPAPSVEAQSGGAKWFGPADASKPAEGWVFRVPVVATNDREYFLRNPQVVAEIDVGRLLVAAGWINQTSARETIPRGFTLDVSSIRVVEYEAGFRDFKDGTAKETAHLFYPSLFETPMRGRAFNASTNPTGTLVWNVHGALEPQAKRYYYVYFTAREYGTVPASALLEKEFGTVRSNPYAGAGQVFYWYENGARGGVNRIDVSALYPDTEVAIYREELLGQYRLLKLSGLPNYHGNPDVLMNETNGDTFAYPIPQNAWYKLVASKPVVVGSRGALQQPVDGGIATQYGAGSFALSLDGGHAGTTFLVPLYAKAMRVYATESGRTTVTARFGGRPVELDATNPVGDITIPDLSLQGGDVSFNLIRATRPVLLQYDGYDGQVHQVPAFSGAPTGSTFGFRSRNEEVVNVRAVGPADVRIADPLQPSTQIYPPGLRSERPGAVPVGCNKADSGLALSVNASWTNQPPVLLTSENAQGFAGAPVSVESGGKPGRTAGFYGGEGGQRVLATGPLSVSAHYNETRLTVLECTSKGVLTKTISLQRDGRFHLDGPGGRPNGGDSKAHYEILANKPVSVYATTVLENYARMVPGRPLPLATDVGALEFRGHLVDLQSAERPGRQVFKTTGPSKPVDFKLTAFNLGQWIGGANLQDTITISCTPFALWEISGCGSAEDALEITLGSQSSKSFTLTVKPRDAKPNDRGEILVTATSRTTGVKATLLLVVVVEVNYDVGMWFDFVGARTRIEPPRSVDRGEATAFTVVVKNRGSVRDTYEITKVVAADAVGWTSRFVRDSADEEETTRVTLDPDEVATFRLEVNAPPLDQGDRVANFFDVTLTAQSFSSQGAAATVIASTRIRADIQFALTVDEPTKLAEPGKAARFTLSLMNRGTAIARIALAPEGILPPGWSTRIVGRDGQPFTDIDLPPAAALNVSLDVVPPADARAGDLATARIGARMTVGDESRTAEESATVVVRQVHNLTFLDPAEIEAVPNEVVRYAIELGNDGNGDEEIELVPSSVRPSWPLRGSAGEGLFIGRGGQGVLEITLTVPEATPARLYEVNFSLRLSREALRNVTIPVLVREVRQLDFDIPAVLRVSPGQEFAFPVDVRNTGNVKDVATLSTTLPAGWKARYEPPTVFLPPGQSARVSLVLNASREAPDGESPITLQAKFPERASSRASEAAARVFVAKPDLVVGEPLKQGSTRLGDVLVVSVPVGNKGRMEAVDVRVALVVNGRAVDSVTLARIPEGAERLATLKWQVDERVEDVKLVVNPDERVVEEDAAGREVVVTFAARSPVPGPSLALVVAALGAVVIVLARRRSL